MKTLLLSMVLVLLVACGGGGGGSSPSPQTPGVVLEKISLSPYETQVPLGTSLTFEATGIYSDKSIVNISDTVTWDIENTDVLSYEQDEGVGKITAIGLGQCLVRVFIGTIEARIQLTVTDAVLRRLEISPAILSVAAGVSVDYHATGIFSDATKKDVSDQVTWQSSDADIASVSIINNQAVFLSSQTGVLTITAHLNDLTASSQVTVSEAALSQIEINPGVVDIAKGLTRQMTATGVYTDNSSKNITADVLWASSDENLVLISNASASKGMMNALSQGVAQITASFGAISASAQITVGNALLQTIYVSAGFQTLPAGLTRPLQAKGLYSDNSVQDLTHEVTWDTSDSQVAVVENGDDKGFLTGIIPGDITVFAYLGQSEGRLPITISDAVLTAIDISPAMGSVPAGQSLQFMATGTYSDNSTADITQEVLWESSDNDIASISNTDGESGWLQAYGQGDVSITAQYKGTMSDSVDIHVSDATLSSIEILPVDESLASGLSLQYQALGHFSDGNDQDLTESVLWQVDNKTLASISNLKGLKGLLYSFGPGNVTVSASFGDISDSTSLTITGETLVEIRSIPAFAVVEEGGTLAMTLEGVFSDYSVRDLTAEVLWVSANAQMAVVNNAPGHEGTITGIGAGQTYILAIFGQVGYVIPLWVLKPVDSIEIIAVNNIIPENWAAEYTATAHYQDGTSEDVTEKVFWESSDPDVADFYAFGQVLGIAEGQTDITVSINGSIYDTVTLEVLAIDNLQMSKDGLQFTAYIPYGNDQFIDLTEQVTWSSSDNSILTISNEVGEKGLAQVHTTGSVSVTAVYNNDVSVTRVVTIN